MTDLTDRMRTCAAAIAVEQASTRHDEVPLLYTDAAALLLAAATEIELLTGPIDLGEPMEVIEPVKSLPPLLQVPPDLPQPGSGFWTDDNLKTVLNAPKSQNACPKCDSRANKTVRKKGKSLWLVCPVCEHAWTR